MTDTRDSNRDAPSQTRAARFFASRVWRWGREILLIILLFTAVLWWQTRDMLPTDGDLRMPNIELSTLDGGMVRVGPDAQRDTLVYFFAPWCSVCRATAPHLQDVDEERTRVVVIALDYSGSDTVREFVQSTGLTHPVLLGTTQTRALFQVQAYPTYYLLDREFRVTGRAMGYLTALGLLMR